MNKFKENNRNIKKALSEVEGKKERLISFRIENKFYDMLKKIAYKKYNDTKAVNKLGYDIMISMIAPEIIKDMSLKKFKDKHKEKLSEIKQLVNTLYFKTDYIQIIKELNLKNAISDLQASKTTVTKDYKKLIKAYNKFNKVYENIE